MTDPCVRRGPGARSPAVRVLVCGLAALGSPGIPAGDLIERAPLGVAGFVGTAQRGPVGEAVVVESPAHFAEVFGRNHPALPSPWLALSVQAFFQNGGERCHVVRAASDALDDVRDALAGLRGVDEVVAVAAPGISATAVQQALIAHCEALGDRVAILDPPQDLGVAGVLEHRAELASPEGYGALYYPWLRVEGAAGREVLLPPSGCVAGVWARTDADTGPWRAPVGAVAGASGVERAIRAGELEELNSAGVNPIRDLAGRGVTVWGSRTVSSDPEWRYVPVRRFLLWLEESLGEGTEWAVFEPNDEPLWARLRSSVGTFLLELFREGALQEKRAEEAYFVRVDRSTMTEPDLEEERTVILVGVAPLRPAEFVVFEIVVDRSARGVLFRRADSNGDGRVDLSDAVSILGFLFLGDPAPGCLAAADANGDGRADLSDAVAILSFLFTGGARPVPPHPECGPLPQRESDRALGCDAPAGC